MKELLTHFVIGIFVVTIMSLVTPIDTFAGRGSGTVRVEGYFRTNGTYVRPHVRTAPDGYAYNNIVSRENKGYGSVHGSFYRSNSSHIVYRNGHTTTERSQTAKRRFLRGLGLKRVPPGYEVDHKIPLFKGGADEPWNMQLLTEEEHHRKTAQDRRRY